MVIVHVIRSLDPAEGGPPMIACRIAAAQASLGHDVHLVHYQVPGSSERVQTMLASLPHHQRIHFHALPSPSMIERLLARNTRSALADLLDRIRPQALHLHNVWDPILRAAAAEAVRRQIPYLILLNGMLDPWSLSQKPWKKRLALVLGYRTMLNRAAALHTGNTDETQLIAPLGLTAPAVIIPNGVFIEEIEPLPPSTSFHAQHPELDGRPFVLFLSRLHYKKGLDYLADAFAIVAHDNSEVRLVVAGPDDGARADFEQRIAQAGLAPRVHIVGPLYGPAKLAALTGSACFCLPSRQEGFSVAITEALACRVPVVVSEQCHFPEVATAGAGFVVKLDPHEIASAVLRVLADAHRATQMGHAGRSLVESRYTWPRVAEQCVAAYQRALSHYGPAAASTSPPNPQPPSGRSPAAAPGPNPPRTWG
ncbi:MAG: glycosyltransferase [Planctomycetota bacterium]|nr:glycosyltransferase [Planctomycetota bacterium]